MTVSRRKWKAKLLHPEFKPVETSADAVDSLARLLVEMVVELHTGRTCPMLRPIDSCKQEPKAAS